MQMLGQLISATKAVIPLKITLLSVAVIYMQAFHEFLRIGEFTIRAVVLVEHVIQRNDLEIVSGNNGLNKTSMRLTIRHAKRQQICRPIVLEITPKSTNCPVAYICRYLHIHSSPSGPPFMCGDNSHMSRTYFLFQLQHVLHTQVATQVLISVTHDA